MLAAAACGLGGGDGGGDQNLPISGIGPYGKITDFDFATPLDEPFLVVDTTADLLDPAPVAAGGGVTRLFYTRRTTSAAEIWRVDLPSLEEEPDAAAPALTAGEPWEQGRVEAPAPFQADGTLYLVYQGGDPAAPSLGLAASTDGGATFQKRGMIIADGAQPGALRIGNATFIYFTRPGGIFVATSIDLASFAVQPQPVLAPAGGTRFDSREVGEPAPAGGISPAGEIRISLFYTGTGASGLTALGYAGSFDGTSFTRGLEPILEPGPPGERGPGPLIAPTRGVLFFSQIRGGRAAIAVATAP
jgi:hypothetical protein